jgi:lysine 6-dehydrogenase
MNPKKVTVLGAGMVGSAIARDLAPRYSVLSADRSEEPLNRLASVPGITTRRADLSDPDAVREAVAGTDLVVGAVPGSMGFNTLRVVIDAGKDVVDISFFGEDPFELDALAKGRNVTAVVDCGVAPGMCHMILGRCAARMEARSFECLVGGLPEERVWPFQYKAPFSPADVLEEYTRPARLVENGVTVTRPALSEPELVRIEGVGTLEAFNTDGLRTLIRTMKVPFMKEKTLRYPGHLDAVRILREGGFLDPDPVEVRGLRVRPIDVASALLFPKWKLEDGEPEFTVMRITVEGLSGGKSVRMEYRLMDRTDRVTRTSSMARTTGYAATSVATLMLEGRFRKPGIVPPEWIGSDETAYQAIMAYQRERGIVYGETVTET